MRLATGVCATLVLFAANSAGADVVAVDPFSGDRFEGFESIQPAGPHAGPMPIFAAEATFDDEFTDPWITFSLSGPGGDLQPWNGNLMGLNPTGWTVFDFDAPTIRFGGYMGVVNEAAGGNVTFFDSEGGVIETLPFSLPKGEWAWRGWQSDTPFARVVIHPAANPGTTSVFDDLEVTFVAALPGDLNCDGVVSVTDIGPFVLALTDPAGYSAQFPDCDINQADLNDDGLVSVGDIGAFVALLTGA